ncbi:MAG: hypothetical protein IH802_09725, partial [Nitrospinae bacterium]|nr:hypothetical protein [Nitrospinota bacterium]
MPPQLIERAGEWDELHRWERSELGKELRRLGLTQGEIRELIPVPKATLSYWCQEIDLTQNQIFSMIGGSKILSVARGSGTKAEIYPEPVFRPDKTWEETDVFMS